ncbi:MAG: glycosyltransferase family 2 protein [Lentisphaeria bacterium]|nr:glycosyltransferase family 2 protein [Lentisphaeria bacterium]
MIKEKLIVVMPVYNEQDCIASVVEKWRAELEKLSGSCDYTLHIYNDGSKDDTWKVLQTLPKGRLVLHDKPNSGHGPTILQAYKELCGKADWLFQTDSDDELSPEYFPLLWEKRQDYDFLCGNRGTYNQPLPRKLISAVSRLSVRVLFGNKVTDVNNPYRLMRTEVFSPLFEKIPGDAFAPNVILSGLASLKGNKVRVYQIPVVPVSRKTGVVSIRKWKLLRAAVRSFFQTFLAALPEARGIWIFIGVILLSLLLKALSGTIGTNYDFDSYCVVKDIVKKGGNVYAETSRYNYGPVWFYVLHFLDSIPFLSFRSALIVFLALCDTAAALILWKIKLRLPSLLFLLSPIGIYISGFHNQFDNFAVLFALCASLILSDKDTFPKEIRTLQAGEEPPPPETKALPLSRLLAGSVLLGVSLCIKHIFIFLPFWFFVSARGKRAKCVLLFLPLFLFGASFLPFAWSELFSAAFFDNLRETGKQLLSGNFRCTFHGFLAALKQNSPVLYGIWENILAYKSFDNRILYKYILPGIFRLGMIPNIVFLCGMLFSGILFRKKSFFFQFLAYTGLLIILTTALTNQYLAIPQLFTSVFYYPFGLLYNLSGILFYCKNPMATYNRALYFLAPILLLCVFAWISRRRIAKTLRKFADILEK